jgi:hypothetical protein
VRRKIIQLDSESTNNTRIIDVCFVALATNAISNRRCRFSSLWIAVKIVTFDHSHQGRAIDAQYSRCSLLVAIRVSQHAGDMQRLKLQSVTGSSGGPSVRKCTSCLKRLLEKLEFVPEILRAHRMIAKGGGAKTAFSSSRMFPGQLWRSSNQRLRAKS